MPGIRTMILAAACAAVAAGAAAQPPLAEIDAFWATVDRAVATTWGSRSIRPADSAVRWSAVQCNVPWSVPRIGAPSAAATFHSSE